MPHPQGEHAPSFTSLSLAFFGAIQDPGCDPELNHLRLAIFRPPHGLFKMWWSHFVFVYYKLYAFWLFTSVQPSRCRYVDHYMLCGHTPTTDVSSHGLMAFVLCATRFLRLVFTDINHLFHLGTNNGLSTMDPSPGTLHPGSRKQLGTQLNIIIMLAGSCKAVPFSQFDEEIKVIVSHFEHIAATKLGFPR